MFVNRVARLLGLRLTRGLAWIAGLVALVLGAVALRPLFDPASLSTTWSAAAAAPASMGVVIGSYFLAFAVRAVLWHRLVPALGFGHALAAIHLSAAGNHLLPLRLGEGLRVAGAVKRAGIDLGEAAASTLTLRAADTLALAVLLALLSPALIAPAVAPLAVLVLLTTLAAAAGVLWMHRLRRRAATTLRLPDVWVAAGAIVAWLLESVVIWHTARWAGLEISAGEAVLVTAATIFAQVIAVAPGGFGTYEASAMGVLVALGAPAAPALSAALAAHALKTLYSLAVGAVALLRPAPAVVGRLRLPRRPATSPLGPGSRPDATRPVLLFLPALNEAPNLPAVLERVPLSVLGHPVDCLVVDDGSCDDTAEVAALGGARVVSHSSTRGLGAAVRTGLAEAVASNAALVAFCDADGEYDPTELESLARPILEGRADFVSGSRFAGGPRRMHLHRLLGNRALSALLSVVARLRITDGQSGYRAFSLPAAACAELVHDYNYAQILTLDLLDKGFAYREVPISYRYRTRGRSFVKPLPYLRAVLPAIYREINGRPGLRRPAEHLDQSWTTWDSKRASASAHI